MNARPVSALLLSLLLPACAAMSPGYDPKLGKVQEKPNIDIGSMDGGSYRMSETEKALDCRKLTGSMQITISRMKDQAERPPPSSLSTTMKGTLAPLMGGSTFNADPQSEVARDRAKLQAYNQALRERGCATLDIEAELAKSPEGPKRY
jgi:hypothetical protein